MSEPGVRNVYGFALRRRREEAGLTQYDLAEKAGVERTYVSKVESGQIRVPGIEKAEAIAAVLGTSHRVILAESERYQEQARREVKARGRPPEWLAGGDEDEVVRRMSRLFPQVTEDWQLNLLEQVELILGVDPDDEV